MYLLLSKKVFRLLYVCNMFLVGLCLLESVLVDMADNKDTLALVREASAVIKSVTSAYSQERIGISFNGGKDSVVMMELLLLTVGEEYLSKCTIFVLEASEDFEELREFRNEYVSNRLPSCTFIHGSAENGICHGLWDLHKQSSFDAVFLGSRKTDPSGKYQGSALCPTTTGWPPLMRACPIFDWSYQDVWHFIITNSIPYCKLYSEGFSSLGLKGETKRHTSLVTSDGLFLPAWVLPLEEVEREGR